MKEKALSCAGLRHLQLTLSPAWLRDFVAACGLARSTAAYDGGFGVYVRCPWDHADRWVNRKWCRVLLPEILAEFVRIACMTAEFLFWFCYWVLSRVCRLNSVLMKLSRSSAFLVCVLAWDSVYSLQGSLNLVKGGVLIMGLGVVV